MTRKLYLELCCSSEKCSYIGVLVQLDCQEVCLVATINLDVYRLVQNDLYFKVKDMTVRHVRYS